MRSQAYALTRDGQHRIRSRIGGIIGRYFEEKRYIVRQYFTVFGESDCYWESPTGTMDAAAHDLLDHHAERHSVHA